MKKLLVVLCAGALVYVLPRLLPRSNTQVHRINQHR
jgi:hypothetical protein